MQFIDTHCHIDFPVFAEKRSEVRERACDVGVSDIVVPGVTAEKWTTLLDIAGSQPMFHPALGLHPCFLEQHKPQNLVLLDELLSRGNICAVGEIGLDLFISGADLEQQLFYLEGQLELAQKYDLPVLLHVRKAHDQMLKSLRSAKLSRGGIVHAYSGSRQQAEQYLQLGFKLGIGGTLTYERAKKLRSIVETLPLEGFVLETDAPDMPLANYRGEINLPQRVVEVAEVMAKLRSCPLEFVSAITSQNAKQIIKSLR
ncbi:TatD family hydrolase [Neptuniibacter sp.]|uniref:TatD family hydrolase n=1 Tax=Neptuniibacter sp. TaxID=1962643 RepID=UPI00261F3647|nr:TatD family hydrolase [Neptuniibacter sp.]MCP4596015.1 TatD family hydrolase [Neptuniibacter sp.]